MPARTDSSRTGPRVHPPEKPRERAAEATPDRPERRAEQPSAPAPDPVDLVGEHSFPASDPPSWWTGR